MAHIAIIRDYFGLLMPEAVCGTLLYAVYFRGASLNSNLGWEDEPGEGEGTSSNSCYAFTPHS